MSKEQQTQQKQNVVQRPLPVPEAPVAEFTPVPTGLENAALFNGLPAVPSTRGIRQAAVLQMQQRQGNAAVQRMLRQQIRPGNNRTSVASRTAVQPKLTVNEPDDQFEKEADQVADDVMRTESAAAPLPPPDDGPPKNGHRPISAVQASGATVPDVVPETEQQIQAMKGNGSPLPEAEREFFEERIGADFSQVRVHTDGDAVQTARDLGAKAYTTGPDIVFNKGEYQPGSSNGRRLLAHELTHVVQQGAAASQVQRQPIPRQFRRTAKTTRPYPAISATNNNIQRLPDFIGEEINDYARHIPGYTLFTVIIGFNPLTGADVPRTAVNLLEGLMGMVPFGTMIFDALQRHGIIQSVFDWVEGQLSRLDLSLSRIERTIEAAWDEMELIEGFSYNLAILERHFGRLYDDVVSFATSLIDHIIEMIKEVALGLAEDLLADNKAWALIKKILHYDPLRGETVEATTVEILEDFLMLIGKETELEQMRERGTLQETADWLDSRIGTFMSLLSELSSLFTAAWDAIQPQNLPELLPNLRSLAQRVVGFLERVWSFASTVALEVLQFIKKALLSWLSEYAHEIPGFHLITVILGKNPFTEEAVPRTAENIIKGFITLLPGGEEKYNQLAESGTIGQAAQRIEGAMEELGINWGMITGLFRGIWDGLSIHDLVDPIGAFQRIVAQFGEPISRLFSFIQIVVKEIFSLILELMNFPSDIVARIINNAMQAYEDIKNDPVAFFNNMLQAVKLGFTSFFDNILQHLLTGVTDWLFGQLEEAGITPPTDLSLESILDLVLQVLGISMEQIWTKLGERIGPENVERIRGAIDRLTGIWNFIRDVQERGVAAIWEYIESQISNLWDMVLEKVRDWIVTEIIERVVTKLLSMLDPTGIMAVVNSFIAFFNAVQSAIEYFREILMIVDDYVSTIASVAQGNVQPGAEKMEQGLASSIPVAIGFLANQVGLGNLAEKISEILGGIREFVDRALDWLLDRVVSMGQSVLNALGFGGEEGAEGEGENAENSEDVQTAISALYTAERERARDGSISLDEAQAIGHQIQGQFPVIRSVTPVSGDSSWNYIIQTAQQTVAGHEPKAGSEQPILQYIGQQVVRRGEGGQADEKLVENLPGYHIAITDGHAYVRKNPSNDSPVSVHIDDQGFLREGSGGRSGPRSADEIFTDQQIRAAIIAEISDDKYIANPPRTTDPALGAPRRQEWVAVFPAQGRQLHVRARGSGRTVEATFGELMNLNVASLETILYQALAGTIRSETGNPTLTPALEGEIGRVAARMAAHVHSVRAFVISPTSIPRYLKAARTSDLIRTNEYSISPSLYEGIASSFNQQSNVKFGEEIHHIVPLYLGGSHNLLNLLRVQGGRGGEREGGISLQHFETLTVESVHQYLHRLVDNQRNVQLILRDQEQEEEITVPSLHDSALRQAISAEGRLRLLIGTLFSEGDIRYQETNTSIQH